MWHDLNAYQTELSKSLYPSQITAVEPDCEFRARTAIRTSGRLSLVKAHASAPFTLEPIAPTAREDSYVLHLQLKGNTAYVHRRGEVTCSTGTLLLTDSRAVLMAEQRSPADAMVVKIPGPLLRGRVREIERLCWLPTQTDAGSAFILRAFLLNLWHWNNHIDQRACEPMAEAMFNLMESSFTGQPCEMSTATTRSRQAYARVRDVIENRMSDPNLTTCHIAQAAGMSRSKLYRLTSEAGTTVEQLIIETRLNHVVRQLEAQPARDVTLTELAFEAGFGDASHFSRCFKRRFGTSPSRYRSRDRE
jgi:AraC-like DNA-binding protein